MDLLWRYPPLIVQALLYAVPEKLGRLSHAHAKVEARPRPAALGWVSEGLEVEVKDYFGDWHACEVSPHFIPPCCDGASDL